MTQYDFPKAPGSTIGCYLHAGPVTRDVILSSRTIGRAVQDPCTLRWTFDSHWRSLDNTDVASRSFDELHDLFAAVADALAHLES